MTLLFVFFCDICSEKQLTRKLFSIVVLKFLELRNMYKIYNNNTIIIQKNVLHCNRLLNLKGILASWKFI